MSMESLVWAMTSARTDGPLERLILIYLADGTQSDESFAMPEEEPLAELAGVSVEAVINAVDRMKSRGLLEAQAGRWYIASPIAPPIALPPGRSPKAQIDPEDRDWIYERDGHQCLRCGGAALSIDHVIPESLGGPTDRTNFQTLCRVCNSWKGTKLGAEFDYRRKVARS
ncbi:HNH endonuclease [Brachybacterium alimentarium]|uniref:HNH endonuclease n=1 Tax=Brachybacterium alimentarium TaxID=47845 RepID=UPI003FD3B07B